VDTSPNEANLFQSLQWLAKTPFFFPFGLLATLTRPLGAVTATASAASAREQLT
jgi:hypothetical protein